MDEYKIAQSRRVRGLGPVQRKALVEVQILPGVSPRPRRPRPFFAYCEVSRIAADRYSAALPVDYQTVSPARCMPIDL